VKADISAAYTLPLGEKRSLQFFTRIDNMLNRTY
jgi:hypothetical protein